MNTMASRFGFFAICVGLLCEIAHGQQIQSRNDAVALLQLKYFERNTLQKPGAVDEALRGEDAYFSCRARWEQICEAIENREKGARLSDVLSQNMAEFRGYVHAKIGARPPDVWMKYLFGKDAGSLAFADDFDEQVSVSLNGTDYDLRLFTFFNDGSITKKGADKASLWTVPLFAAHPPQSIGGWSGPINRGYWYRAELVKETSTLYVWCTGVAGMTYVVAIDDESGKRINLLYLDRLNLGSISRK
jgi:hypothetical protein